MLSASQELQILVIDLELLDLGVKLLNELPKLGLGQGHGRRLSVKWVVLGRHSNTFV
jgi:hypothetical protein